MKILAVAVICLAFLCLLPLSQGKYLEKETPFTEDVEIGEKQDVEVFQVPAHRDVNATESYHDFKMRVTVTKDLSRKVCYIANMDPSMPSPKKLKADIARADSEPGELPITAKEHLVLLTGPANRRSLTKEILDFCGALPIYKAEVFRNPVNGEDGTSTVKSTRRQRRQTRRDYTSCIQSMNHYDDDPLKYVKEKKCLSQPATWLLQCRLKRLGRDCYYNTTCRLSQISPVIDFVYKCDEIPGISSGAVFSFCCDPTCP